MPYLKERGRKLGSTGEAIMAGKTHWRGVCATDSMFDIFTEFSFLSTGSLKGMHLPIISSRPLPLRRSVNCFVEIQ